MSDLAQSAPTPWIGPDGRRVERLELHLSTSCPNECRFCSEAHRMQRYRTQAMPLGRVARVLGEHVERGVRRLHLTGGEPTVHPQFLDVLALAKEHALHTSVGTNGVMLRREAFARRAVALLDEAMFSLHGPSAGVHERLTRRAGSFADVIGAVELTRTLRPALGTAVNVVVTRLNVDVLGDTIALARSLGASLIVVSNLTPEGRGLDAFEELAVPLAKLGEVLPAVAERAGGAVLRFFGVPMCLLGQHAMQSNDLHWDPRVTVEWTTVSEEVALHDVYGWTPSRKRAYARACEDCLQRQVCMGVFDRTLDLHPTDALVPKRRVGT